MQFFTYHDSWVLWPLLYFRQLLRLSTVQHLMYCASIPHFYVKWNVVSLNALDCFQIRSPGVRLYIQSEMDISFKQHCLNISTRVDFRFLNDVFSLSGFLVACQQEELVRRAQSRSCWFLLTFCMQASGTTPISASVPQCVLIYYFSDLCTWWFTQLCIILRNDGGCFNPTFRVDLKSFVRCFTWFAYL